MRKIIAFTSICFLFLVLKNESGNCKSACEVSKMVITLPDVIPDFTDPDLNDDINTEPVTMKPYDGFFIKI